MINCRNGGNGCNYIKSEDALYCILQRGWLIGYLILKNRKPPMTTNEKQDTSSTTKDLQHIYRKFID